MESVSPIGRIGAEVCPGAADQLVNPDRSADLTRTSLARLVRLSPDATRRSRAFRTGTFASYLCTERAEGMRTVIKSSLSTAIVRSSCRITRGLYVYFRST